MLSVILLVHKCLCCKTGVYGSTQCVYENHMAECEVIRKKNKKHKVDSVVSLSCNTQILPPSSVQQDQSSDPLVKHWSV